MAAPLDPRVADWLLSLALLLGSYVAARVLSFVLGRALLRTVARTRSTLDDKLLVALQGPLTYAIFLIGAWAAVHRLPLDERWIRPMDGALFVLGGLIVTVALVRSFTLLFEWYLARPEAAGSALGSEFGPLVSKMGRIFIALVALIAVLEHFQVNVASLVVSLGVGSLAVGLAAQDTLANMFAGFTLLVDRPFRIGDRVRLSTGEQGDVQTIGIRATLIKTLDDTILIVPNSVLVKDRLTNLSLPARNIVGTIELAVAYGVDLEKVRGLLVEAAAGASHVAPEPAPNALVQRFGEYALHVSIGFHARDYSSLAVARSEVFERAYAALQKAGIPIAVAPRPTLNA